MSNLADLKGPVVNGVEALERRALLSAYFVSAEGGSDANPGTATAPWASLQRAADLVNAGDVVTVGPGSYSGFDLRRDGTSSARITFRAEPGAIINSRNSRTADGINLEGADYVTIDGFNVFNTSGTITRAGIRSVVNTGIVIRGNVTDNIGTWGIFTGFSENVLIEGNTTSQSQLEHGIYVSNSADNPVIRGNTSFGNRANGIHLNGDASAGGDGIISNAIIEGNIIYDNGRAGGSGINADGVQNSLIRNNLLYGNHASGISLYRIDAGGSSSGNVVVNNTILVAADGRWAVNIQNGSTGNTLFNNILYNEGTYRGVVSISLDSLTGFTSDYNAVMDRFTTNDGDSRMTLAQWRQTTGQDTHSFIATSVELFVDPAGRDFRLKAASPAIDAGIATLSAGSAPTSDVAGTLRPQGTAHDLGAFETVAVSPPTTALQWSSVAVHGRGVGPAPLVIPDDGTFSEGRVSGIGTIAVEYSGPIDAASVSPAAVKVWGNGADGQPVNLSGVQVSTAAEGNKVVITFSPSLPDYARYAIRLQGVADKAGRMVAGDNDRIITALLGDVTGDLRVDNTDVGATKSLRSIDLIDPNVRNEVRADATIDGRIDNTDVGGVMSMRGHDARWIPAPSDAPAELTATATSGTIHLSWTDRSSSEARYAVEGSPDATSWSAIATLRPDATSYADTDVISKGYFHRILMHRADAEFL